MMDGAAAETVGIAGRNLDTLALSTDFPKLTHYLFRYPAKFHPPVVEALLKRYTDSGSIVLDPFCGSGTLLVEAAVLGRRSIGIDIDPLAVAVSRAKTLRLDPSRLGRIASNLDEAAARHERSTEEYKLRAHEDLTLQEYEAASGALSAWIPQIPNLSHWFRRYVVVDLAHIRATVETMKMPEPFRHFIKVVFGSIIRNASNADPVPVSGLEVTRWMRERDAAGRVVNPFSLLRKALKAAVVAATEFTERTGDSGANARALQGDATELSQLRKMRADAVITSPPYHGAVDYYRRHQLEMYWLGLTVSHSERLDLLRQYIGRPHVPPRHPWVHDPLRSPLAKEWEARIHDVSRNRAYAFRHYIAAMTRFFDGLTKHLPAGAPAVLVVGHSAWKDAQIPTADLFDEISGSGFHFDEALSYPVKNRYMSYSRHNQADISREFVLTLRRTSQRS